MKKIKIISVIAVAGLMIFVTGCKGSKKEAAKEGANIAVEIVNATAQTAVSHTEDAITDTVSGYANTINDKIASYSGTASEVLSDAGADTLKENLDNYTEITTDTISKAENFINTKISGTADIINSGLSKGSKFAKSKISEQIDKRMEDDKGSESAE